MATQSENETWAADLLAALRADDHDKLAALMGMIPAFDRSTVRICARGVIQSITGEDPGDAVIE